MLIAIPMRAGEIAEVRSASAGRQALLLLNPLMSDVPRGLVVLLLLAQLPSWFLESSRLVGGLVLMYVVSRAMRKAYGHGKDRERVANGSMAQPQSLALWLLDPVLYILWATVNGPLLLTGWRQDPSLGIVFLGGLYGTVVVGLSIFFVITHAARKHGPLIVRVVSAFYMAAVIGFALIQIWRGSEALGGRLL